MTKIFHYTIVLLKQLPKIQKKINLYYWAATMNMEVNQKKCNKTFCCWRFIITSPNISHFVYWFLEESLKSVWFLLSIIKKNWIIGQFQSIVCGMTPANMDLIVHYFGISIWIFTWEQSREIRVCTCTSKMAKVTRFVFWLRKTTDLCYPMLFHSSHGWDHEAFLVQPKNYRVWFYRNKLRKQLTWKWYQLTHLFQLPFSVLLRRVWAVSLLCSDTDFYVPSFKTYRPTRKLISKFS